MLKDDFRRLNAHEMYASIKYRFTPKWFIQTTRNRIF